MVLFKKTICLLIFRLLNVSITERGAFKSPPVTPGFSVSPFGSGEFRLTYSDALSRGAHASKIAAPFRDFAPSLRRHGSFYL